MIFSRMGAIFGRDGTASKQLMLIASAVAVLIILADVKFVLLPQIAGILEARNKVEKIQADLSKAESDIAKISGMKTTIESYNEKLGQRRKALPAEEGTSDLLGILSEMAKSANVSISGIAPSGQKMTAPDSPVYKMIPIAINAKAGYHELGHFLASLENADRFMSVADMHIKANASTPYKHDVELLVVTYSLRESK